MVRPAFGGLARPWSLSHKPEIRSRLSETRALFQAFDLRVCNLPGFSNRLHGDLGFSNPPQMISRPRESAGGARSLLVGALLSNLRTAACFENSGCWIC